MSPGERQLGIGIVRHHERTAKRHVHNLPHSKVPRIHATRQHFAVYDVLATRNNDHVGEGHRGATAVTNHATVPCLRRVAGPTACCSEDAWPSTWSAAHTDASRPGTATDRGDTCRPIASHSN